ncbi:response regulator [Streptosporangium sp. NPDC004379]|uniref:response regulator n=1 Tax=Streptosporangium sp. NPDC004379 TaxID=3366189 RepID=UPI0036854C4D
MVDTSGTDGRGAGRGASGVEELDLRRLLAGLTAVRDGDFGTRLPDDGDGLLKEAGGRRLRAPGDRPPAPFRRLARRAGRAVQTAHPGGGRRAKQLALASKYKSEFLANMSQELRTPLNSLLILAQLLAQNPARNLTAKQVEYANVIHSAGTDLLQLINDILDLSKIEAGKMNITLEPLDLRRLLDYVEATFRPLTTEKDLRFDVTVAPDVPEELLVDEQRLRQVLRNLLSNAVKFTETGSVGLRIERPTGTGLPGVPGQDVLAFHVTDTGIGIAEENLSQIFDAFQQADGTTSRKYGGTGLGLSISREIATLFNGEIRAVSVLGEGSTFSLLLPIAGVATGAAAVRPAPLPVPGDRPAPETAAAGPAPAAGAAQGAERRRLLVMESRPNGLLSQIAESAVADLSATHGPVVVSTAGDPAAAIDVLKGAVHHCIVLDLGMRQDGAAEFLRLLDEDPVLRDLPVLAHHTRTLTRPQENLLKGRSNTQPLERIPSLDELRERIALHLSAHAPGGVPPLVQPSLEEHPRAMDDADTVLVNRKVLVIDDDVRNVFALTNILELHGMEVLYAENGRRGIDVLSRNEDISLVLMDIMMPEMDGYVATAAIRKMPRFADLPIIAVAAKAMHGDREKTLAAGASDYVTKPVDSQELISRIQQWMGL